jgi:membrane protease YdiL (CAAX protease family)
MTELGRLLEENRAVQAAEIAVVFLVAFAVVGSGWSLVGESQIARQAVVWVANVAMLITIWVGLRLRGQTFQHFGLGFHFGGARALIRTVLQAIGVLVFAVVAFVAGSMLAMSLAAAPETADMSGYDYLRGNLPMLLAALPAVWLVSSFGEEVVYRGFLIHRLAEMGGGTRAAWAIALVSSAAIFGLAHFAWGVVGIVQTALMGLALAVSYLVVGRNLWVLVLAHACLDTVLLVQLYLGAGASG